jgi:hypothetical protein
MATAMGAVNRQSTVRVFEMYHCTSATAATAIKKDGFKQSKTGTLGRGVYVDEPRSSVRVSS